MPLDRMSYNLLFQLKVVRTPVTSMFSSFCYTMNGLYNIIIMCINNNDLIINNYGRLQDLIFLYRVPMWTQKYFFDIYREFGHKP